MYGRRVGENTICGSRRTGRVDELNAALGMARAQAKLPLVKKELLLIQKQLVALMGELAVAPQDAERYAKDKYPQLTPGDAAASRRPGREDREGEDHVRRLGDAGGERGVGGARCGADDVPAGRSGWWAKLATSNEVDMLVIRYLNRLSDILWLLARYTRDVVVLTCLLRRLFLEISQRFLRVAGANSGRPTRGQDA